MAKPVLFAHPLSPYSRKAALVLNFMGLDYQYEMTAPHADNPDFKAASPLGKIPAFKDDHVAFADSSVITHYVCRFHDGETVLPETPAEFAQSLWYEEYADTIMTPVIGGHLFAEVVLARPLFNREPIQGDIDQAINEELPGIYAFLNERLEGREWLASDRPTIGDIAVGGLLQALYHCGQEVPASAPNLQAYVERFFALPEVKKVMAQEVQVMQAIKYDTPMAARIQ